MDKRIKSLNDKIKYSILNVNRNIIAAICLIELNKLLATLEYTEDIMLVLKHIETLRYHLQSSLPMVLEFDKLPVHNIMDMIPCYNRYILLEDKGRMLLEKHNDGILLESREI